MEIKTFKGWVSKDAKLSKVVRWDKRSGCLIADLIYQTKGNRDEWLNEERTWPPRRVEVTVKILD